MKTTKTYHKNGELSYERYEFSDEGWSERTYDEKGNQLALKSSTGDWHEYIYDENGNQLSYKNSNGYWTESVYDEEGNKLTFKNSNGVILNFNNNLKTNTNEITE